MHASPQAQIHPRAMPPAGRLVGLLFDSAFPAEAESWLSFESEQPWERTDVDERRSAAPPAATQ